MPKLPRLTIYGAPRKLWTFKQVRRRARHFGFHAEVLDYERAVHRRRLPAGAAIFTDFERLAPPWLEIAGVLRGRVAATGAPVLNDPARFLPRAALIRKLFREGVNGYTCWLPVLGEVPERFPVFLRTGWAHRGVFSDLLESAEAAQEALEAALAAGHVLSDLVFIEYAGLTREGGVFRKRAAYGVAGEVVPAVTVTDPNWVAKTGTKGAASAEQYAADLADLDAYPYGDVVRRVMEIAGQDFGRVDFGLTQSGVAVFELNTNPQIVRGSSHPDANRMAAEARMEIMLMERLADLARRGEGAPPAELTGAITWRGRWKKAPKMP